MFTLATSFLIFSASAFTLISTLIAKTAESLIGADLTATAALGDHTFLDELPMQAFLETQVAEEGQPVLDFAFTSAPSKWWYGSDDNPYVEDNARYSAYRTTIYAAPSNYLNVVDLEFYVPTDI